MLAAPRLRSLPANLRFHRVKSPIAAAALALVAACAVSTFSADTPIRPASDLPARFDPPPGFDRVAPADTLPGAACLSPLRDPRDGAELRMVRSSGTLADYEVPAGRYDVGEAELLRVDCNTGAPRGIVAR